MKRLSVLTMALLVTASFSLMAQSSRKNLNLSGFESIGVGVPLTVHVVKGDYKVEVSGPDAAIGNLEIEVKNNSLSIGKEKKRKKWGNKDVSVYVSMPTIKGLSIGGSGTILVEDSFENLDDLDIAIGGSGEIEMSGSAKKVKISIAGSGEINAADLNATSCEVSIAGSGEVYVGELESLDVSIAGSGEVKYKGDPDIKKSIAGSGEISRM
jgi:hypothetical protein